MRLLTLYRWRSSHVISAIALMVASSVTGAQAAYADVVRIISVNGDYSLTRAGTVDAQPGDVVQLSADVLREDFSADSGYTATNEYVEEFTWTSKESTGITYHCDADASETCLTDSYFEVTEYGVNFYVPDDFDGRSIEIIVRHKGTLQEDKLILMNSAFQEPVAQEPVFDSDDYNYNEVNSRLALSGHGRWVKINNTRYFSPYHYATEDWAPYRHGAWQWDDTHGWVWSSYDPWGWYTDHYGYWRNHKVYGWVWAEYPDRRWRPHSVTWHYSDGHIGWYPYNHKYRRGYQHGYSHGWIDGYADGYNAGRYYRHSSYGYRYRLGWTAVRHSHFYGRNVYDHWRSYETSVRVGWFRVSYTRTYYGGYIGGRDYRYSRVWVERRLGRRAPTTRIVTRRIGNRRIRKVQRVWGVPGRYREIRTVRREVFRTRQRLPVGTVIRTVRRNGRIVNRDIIRPARGRGIAHAPRHRRNGVERVVVRRSRRGIEHNRNHPIHRRVRANRPNRPNRPGMATRPNRPNRPGMATRPNRPNRPGMATRPNRPNRPGMATRPNRPNRPGMATRPNRPNRPGMATRPNRPNRPGMATRPSRPNRPGMATRPNRPNRPGMATRPNRPNRPGMATRPSRPSRPAMASRPSRPSRPAMASRPSRPSRPAMASRPSRPSRPAMASRPSRPSRPAMASRPSRPSRPAMASRPSRPSRPAMSSGGRSGRSGGGMARRGMGRRR